MLIPKNKLEGNSLTGNERATLTSK